MNSKGLIGKIILLLIVLLVVSGGISYFTLKEKFIQWMEGDKPSVSANAVDTLEDKIIDVENLSFMENQSIKDIDLEN